MDTTKAQSDQSHSPGIRPDRVRVDFECSICHKQRWTLRCNYDPNNICAWCKKKLNPNYDPKKGKDKALETARLRGSYKKGAAKAAQTRLEKYGPSRCRDPEAKRQALLKYAYDPEWQAARIKKARDNHGGSYHSAEGRKNIGSNPNLELMSKCSKENMKRRRNSAEHIAYEIAVLENKGFQNIVTKVDDDNETYFEFTCPTCGELIEWHMLSGKNGTYSHPFCRTCFKAGFSNQEKELASYVKELGFEIIENDRQILQGKELDIVIPSLKIAIEYDGFYWHLGVNNFEKMTCCLEAGYDLIRITEPDWVLRKEETKIYLHNFLVDKIIPKGRLPRDKYPTRVVETTPCKEYYNADMSYSETPTELWLWNYGYWENT